MSRKIKVIISEKGGVGKSTIAQHIIPPYFLKKNSKENADRKVYLYEFDAHNESLNGIGNDKNMEVRLVRGEKEDMAKAFAEIEFDSNFHDIIIDVGGSDNVDRFLEIASKNRIIAENMIFIIPEEKKTLLSTEKTIWNIREKISMDAKIIVALNKHGEKKLEDEFPFVFGRESLGIKPSDLLQDEAISFVGIPESDTILAMAFLEKVTLWEKGKMARELENKTMEERFVLWGREERNEPINSKSKETCTKQYYVKKKLELGISELAMEAISKSSMLYAKLEQIDNMGK